MANTFKLLFTPYEYDCNFLITTNETYRCHYHSMLTVTLYNIQPISRDRNHSRNRTVWTNLKRQTDYVKQPYTQTHRTEHTVIHTLCTTDLSGRRSWYFSVCPSLSGCSFSLCTVADVYLRFSVDPYLYYVMALNQRNGSSLYACLLLCSSDLYSPFKVLVQNCL